MVDWSPWANITTRMLVGLGFGCWVRTLATAGRSLGSGSPFALAQASASASLPTINIGRDFLELSTEKLSNEGSREVKGEDRSCEVTSGGYLASSSYLPFLPSLLTEFQVRVGIVGQEVTIDVEDLGDINERADSW